MKLLWAAFVALVLMQAPAHAQVTRSWVSGVGDDINPCSRTSPCKTFAGALAKTSAGGTISIIDAGGYGSVIIDKSISIIGDQSTTGIIADNGPGITINAGPNDVVHLRGLYILGFQPGSSSGINSGINIVKAAAVYVEDSTIRGFAGGSAIALSTANWAKLFVSNSTLTLNNSGVTATAGDNEIVLDRVRIVRNQNGVTAPGNLTIFHLNNSVFADNTVAINRVGGRILSSRTNAFVGNVSNGQGAGAEPLK
jgi:hypothetical protein